MTIPIRPATAADIPAMTGLLALLFSIEADFAPDAAKQAEGLRLLLERPDACVLVAEHDGSVVGMCTAQTLVSTAEGGKVGLVEDVVVRADCRGRGIGSAMLKALEDWAVDQKLARLQLLADRYNAPALGFYKKHGWSTTQLINLKRALR